MSEETQNTVTEVADPLREPRLQTETGVEARVVSIVEPVIIDLGYRLVRVRFTGMNGATLQIFAEKADGTIGVDDCEIISKALSPVLDVDDPIGKAYHLEISSPGIDRPLVRKSDYVRWAGFEAKMEFSVGISGRKRHRGYLKGVDGDNGLMRLLQPLDDGTMEITFPLEAVDECKLVLNEALIRESLRAAKKAEEEDAARAAEEAENE